MVSSLGHLVAQATLVDKKIVSWYDALHGLSHAVRHSCGTIEAFSLMLQAVVLGPFCAALGSKTAREDLQLWSSLMRSGGVHAITLVLKDSGKPGLCMMAPYTTSDMIASCSDCLDYLRFIQYICASAALLTMSSSISHESDDLRGSKIGRRKIRLRLWSDDKTWTTAQSFS